MHGSVGVVNDGSQEFALAISEASCETVETVFKSMTRISLPHWLVAATLSAAVVVSTQAQDATTQEGAAAPAPAQAEAAALDIKDPVAVVNGENITKEQLETAFNNAVSAAGVDPSNLSSQQKLAGYQQILQDMISEKLVTEAAKGIEVTDADVDAEVAKIKEQFPTPEAFQEQLKQSGQTEEKLKELIKSGLAQRKWIESQISDATKVTDEDAKKFYDENAKDFDQPAMVRASHILFMVPEEGGEDAAKEKEAAAKKAAEEARKDGTDFNELAKKLSEEPGASESGGDLDFFAKEQMVPEFADAAFGMDIGQISDPVKTQFGYHVIKVTDKKEAGKMDFEEVKPQLLTFLQGQKSQEEVAKLLEKLRADAKVTVNLPEPAPAAAPTMPGAAEPAATTPAAGN